MQRDIDWFEARKGKFTASEIHKLMGAKGFGQTGETYIFEKVAETLATELQEVSSKEMEWGTNLEPEAKTAYFKATGFKIKEVGFMPLKGYEEHAGASPDGLINDELGIEIKCPYTLVNHIKYAVYYDLKTQKPEYYWQVQMCMLVTGRAKWHFVSYHPFFKAANCLYITEITANESDQNLLIERIKLAIEMKKSILLKLK